MSQPFTVVIVDDRRSERFEILCSRIQKAVPDRTERIWWLSEFSLSSWSRDEIASGVAFGDVLDAKPKLLIFDLVLYEGDQTLSKIHPWDRGLKLLEALYTFAMRQRLLDNLPRRAILISATFGVGGEHGPDFRQFKLASEELATRLDIGIDFFDWGEIASATAKGNEISDKFSKTIRDIIEDL